VVVVRVPQSPSVAFAKCNFAMTARLDIKHAQSAKIFYAPPVLENPRIQEFAMEHKQDRSMLKIQDLLPKNKKLKLNQFQ
jgi:hypothetical protein